MRRGLWLLAGIALAAYAIPLLAPPAAVAPAPVAPDAPWLARVLPGVPEGWVGGRLFALAVGAAAVALLVRRTVLLPLGAPSPSPLRWAQAPAVALGVATGHAMASLWAARLDRAGQLLYVLTLAVPALILLAARRPGGARREHGGELAWTLPLVAIWAVWRGVLAVHAPEAADVVDTWFGFEYVVAAATGSANLLTQGFLPGFPGTYLFFQGVPLFGAERVAPSFARLQVLHLMWTAVAGLGVGRLAARLVGATAAPVASAVFLFSPFVLFLPLNPSPFFLGPLVAVALLLLLEAHHRRRSPAALAALGGLGGTAILMPPIAPVAAAVGLAALASSLRRPRPSAIVFATACLSLVAAVLPALPAVLAGLRSTADVYVFSGGLWSGLELAALGQLPPADALRFWGAGEPLLRDLVLGTALAPFAIPRTPLRLWGDALFDPLGAALAAAGLAVCVRHARRGPQGLLLAAFLAALLPGALSSYDRPSLTRLFVTPVPLALLAVVGLEALRRHALPRVRPATLAVVTVVLVAAGGTALFDAVNPRILARSWLGLALRALDGAPADAVLLAHADAPYHGGPPGADLRWLHARRIASQVPATPLPVAAWEGPASLDAAPESPTRLFLWSPALQHDADVAGRVCARWPGAALYEIRDAAGISRVLAASPAGAGWTPALPASQWTAQGCLPGAHASLQRGAPG